MKTIAETNESSLDGEQGCPCDDSSCTTCGGRCWHLCHFMPSEDGKTSVCNGCGKTV